MISVADSDPPEGSGPFWSEGPDTNPDPGLNKLPYINLFGVCESHKYFRNLCFFTFWFMNIIFKNITAKKMSRRNLVENLVRSGSGSKRFQKSDPDPIKNRPDPQQ
jgi:hypothetical protein